MSISQMSVAGGTLVLITAILRLTLQRRLPRRTFLALWGVALARFLIPFSIPSPVSAYTVVSRAPALNETVKRLTAATTVAAYPVAGTANSAPLSSDARAAASFPWLAAVWIIGALLCAAFFVFNHLRSRRVYAQSLPCRELPVLIDVNHNGPWRKIAVRVSDQIITSLTYGLFRPVILLPKRMKEESRDFVLAHELCHIRRMDVLWKSLFALCACVHWFNPTAWLMLFLVNRDLELSCDESVIRNRDGKTRKAYALTLIHISVSIANF